MNTNKPQEFAERQMTAMMKLKIERFLNRVFQINDGRQS